jgi:hypothetical protein
MAAYPPSAIKPRRPFHVLRDGRDFAESSPRSRRKSSLKFGVRARRLAAAVAKAMPSRVHVGKRIPLRSPRQGAGGLLRGAVTNHPALRDVLGFGEAASSVCRSPDGGIFFFEKRSILFLKIKLRAILYDRLLYSVPSCPSPRRNLSPRFGPQRPRNLRAVQLRRLATAGRRLWIRGRSDMGLWVAHTAHADGLWGLRGFGRSPPLRLIRPPASPDCGSPGSATQWARACDDQRGPSRGAGPAEQDAAPPRPRLREAAAPLPRRNAGFDGREIFLRATH